MSLVKRTFLQVTVGFAFGCGRVKRPVGHGSGDAERTGAPCICSSAGEREPAPPGDTEGPAGPLGEAGPSEGLAGGPRESARKGSSLESSSPPPPPHHGGPGGPHPLAPLPPLRARPAGLPLARLHSSAVPRSPGSAVTAVSLKSVLHKSSA